MPTQRTAAASPAEHAAALRERTLRAANATDAYRTQIADASQLLRGLTLLKGFEPDDIAALRAACAHLERPGRLALIQGGAS